VPARVGNHCGVRRKPAHFRRIDIDTDGFQAVGAKRPAEHGRQFHAGADTDHEIGARPELIGRRHGQPEFVRVADDAAAAAERHHRRVDQFRKLENFIAGVNSPAADEDHRRLAISDQGGCGLDALGIGLRRRKGIERL
jgi:hypothetical protein